MGKAYTDEEKQQIRNELLEAGLALFHDSGIQNISIRDLTSKVGIAQGGFYNFFPDKDTFISEIVYYRTKQKLLLFEESFPLSIKDPVSYVSNAIFSGSWDLKQKADQKQVYADTLKLYVDRRFSNKERIYAALYDSFEHLANYWQQQSLLITMDISGIMNVIKGALILYTNLEQLDRAYTESLIRTFIYENCRNYIIGGYTS